ncbi:hypothetical protein OEG86_13140 [Hoeflea alexandrii]|nr:hypothetical protein [Hoeflea alexandrii]MCY0153023.1 hypothetical protein [Hoeflea alexandrii]
MVTLTMAAARCMRWASKAASAANALAFDDEKLFCGVADMA